MFECPGHTMTPFAFVVLVRSSNVASLPRGRRSMTCPEHTACGAAVTVTRYGLSSDTGDGATASCTGTSLACAGAKVGIPNRVGAVATSAAITTGKPLDLMGHRTFPGPVCIGGRAYTAYGDRPRARGCPYADCIKHAGFVSGASQLPCDRKPGCCTTL